LRWPPVVHGRRPCATLGCVSASNPSPDPVSAEDVSSEMSPEDEAELRHALVEAEEGQRGGELIPREELFAELRSRGAVELDPEEKEELDRRSREAQELDARGLLPSGDDHIRRLRASLEQRRAG